MRYLYKKINNFIIILFLNMGSELFKQYQVDKSTYITGGHMNMWKIYNGTHNPNKGRN